MTPELSQREKIFLGGGAAVLALLFVAFAIISPYRSLLNSLDEDIVEHKQQLQTLRDMQREFGQMQNELQRQQSKLGRSSSSAFTTIESIVSRLGFADRLVAMRPQAPGSRQQLEVESVTARLERLELKQLLDLLGAFEKSTTLLNVTSLQIKRRYDEETLLDVEMQIETLRQGRQG